MQGFVHISRAASLALHSVLIIKDSDKKLNAFEIAKKLNASGHHVAKVLQKLAKAEILTSWRGPGGGFSLKKPPEEIRLISIYECIDGKLDKTSGHCNEKEICPLGQCIWGKFGENTHLRFIDYLSKKKLSDFE